MIGGEFAVKNDALTSAALVSFYTLEQGQVFARDAECTFRFKGGDR